MPLSKTSDGLNDAVPHLVTFEMKPLGSITFLIELVHLIKLAFFL